ncbi:MAG: methionine adenosyltransferase [Eubacteriales bacterium]|nr:methionine adenosyltransferase [Eubacteriales bacterium]
MKNRYFTSESVTEGHPDKVCDRISDNILNEILKQDPDARVACETCVNTGLVVLMGEITTTAKVHFEQIVRETIADIGYDKEEYGFSAQTAKILLSIDRQSADIAMGVDRALEVKEGTAEEELGAGDQGMMFGYATNETPELMPFAIAMAHKLARRLTTVRKEGIIPYLRPDGKTQVTVIYDEENRPVGIDAVVVSAQHDPEVEIDMLRRDIREHVIDVIIPRDMVNEETKYFINPTGRFVIGGPAGDSGLTGRKIIVDSYGGSAAHGGGAFSGKDCTKVDRSASYFARYMAKNIVAAGLADRCEIQLSYAIGVAEPMSVEVNTFGTGKPLTKDIHEIIREHFDMRPSAIIKKLQLRRPIYEDVSAYGHFGRDDLNLPWEATDATETLKGYLKN